MKVFNDESISTFLDEISNTDPIPSGGAVIGLTGALASSLATMVANLSVLNKKYESVKEINKMLSELFINAKSNYLNLIQLDSTAYLMLRQAYKEPTKNPEEKEQRIKDSIIACCEAPCEIILLGNKITQALIQLYQTGTKMAVSDVGVSATLVEATLQSSWLTILINYNSLEEKNDNLKKKIKETKEVKEKTIKKLKELFKTIEEDLNQNDI